MTRDGNVTLKPGVTLFEYRIDSILGQGGFGITYKATDLQLNRTVAIKEYFPREFSHRDLHTARVVPHGNEEDRETFEWGLKRFLAEARTLARFHHPSIVAIRRFFEFNDTAYIVMDFAEGRSLSEILKEKGTLPWNEVKSFLPSLLEGLAIVHKAGVLHRDIKPANIYLRHDGTPILLDFGSASQEIVQHSRSVTSIASAGYGAVEQYSTHGKQAEYTDIYGLAATLYHVVTGKKPQDAPDRILDDKLDPASKVCQGKYPASFLSAIDNGLNIRPQNRPKDIADWKGSLLSDDDNRPIQLISNRKSKDNFGSSSVISISDKSKKNKIKQYSFQAMVIIAVLVWIVFLFRNNEKEQPASTENVISNSVGEENNSQYNKPNSDSATSNNGELEIRIKQGMPYPKARKILLESGWQTVDTHKLPNGQPLCYLVATRRDLSLQNDKRCNFLEIDDCSGTGMGYCKMMFYDGKGIYLSVITSGGEPSGDENSADSNEPIIDSWDKETSYKARKTDWDELRSTDIETAIDAGELNERKILAEMLKENINQISKSYTAISFYKNPCPEDVNLMWDKCYGEASIQGRLFRGDWKNNWPNGIGVSTANSYVYIGAVSEGKSEGYGKKIYSSGAIYIGNFKNNERHGRGVFFETNGNRFVGNFINDYANGYGTLFRANGSIVSGVWHEDEKTKFRLIAQ